MKCNAAFKKWEKPYLFKEIEEIMSGMSGAESERVIPLGIGDPDLPTPAAIRKAIIREHQTCYHGYPTVEGRRDLREAIASYYHQRFGCVLSAGEIMVGMGAKTDLFDIPHVFADPGDTAVILDPAYPVYCDAVLFNNLEIAFLRGTPENNYLPAVDSSEIDPGKTSLIFLCYPNNPTGVVATRSYVSEMIDFAHACNAVIVFDIAYVDFTPGEGNGLGFSIFELPGAEEVAIEVGSFSKPFSMPGDRISWVAIRNPQIMNCWRRYRANRDSGASNYEQAGALAALTDPEVALEVKKNMLIYKNRADILMDGLLKMGLQVYGLRNSPYAWFTSPIPDSKSAVAKFLKEAGVLLTPGAGFGPAGEGFLRATLFQPEDRLREAVNRLASVNF